MESLPETMNSLCMRCIISVFFVCTWVVKFLLQESGLHCRQCRLLHHTVNQCSMWCDYELHNLCVCRVDRQSSVITTQAKLAEHCILEQLAFSFSTKQRIPQWRFRSDVVF